MYIHENAPPFDLPPRAGSNIAPALHGAVGTDGRGENEKQIPLPPSLPLPFCWHEPRGSHFANPGLIAAITPAEQRKGQCLESPLFSLNSSSFKARRAEEEGARRAASPSIVLYCMHVGTLFSTGRFEFRRGMQTRFAPASTYSRAERQLANLFPPREVPPTPSLDGAGGGVGTGADDDGE